MTLTVPTWDLVGVVADCVPFAFPKDDIPSLNGVRLEWDGSMLHALSTDQLRVAWSQWHPDDDPPFEVQDELGASWGSGDHPWGVFLSLADARKLVAVYKLPPKQSRAALTVDVDLDRITVHRSDDTGHPEITCVFHSVDTTLPDHRGMIAKASTLKRVDQLAFGARQLADFGKVRPAGPLELRFTGNHSPVHVAIGKRFVGAIQPVKLDPEDGGDAR